MTYKVGESISNIQINISELQKQCAMFDMELESVIALAKQIQKDASVLINECGEEDGFISRQSADGPIDSGFNPRPGCGTCRYWNDTDRDGEVSFAGECRRRAPELVLDDGLEFAGWPPVDRNQWCGEYVVELFN
jgi:hypothetical protein